ncbi:MAG: cupin domain-containing protein [Alphaproteobacteria bacterium]|nr:cupin domain-containing protein [Alphaproteobacteria bacterium]MCW5744062.1 cupin domain-containing protein [Alphaproteobacteria bacterium]
MTAHDINASLAGLAELKVNAATTGEDAMAAIRQLANFNQCMMGVVRFSGLTPWERHPDDELLYVVEGAVEVTILDGKGAANVSTMQAGSICIVPAGCWHRQNPKPSVALLFLTSREGNEATWDETPGIAA